MSKFARYCLGLVLFGQIVLFCGMASAAKKKTPPVTDGEGWKSDPKFDLVIDKIAARESLAIKGLGEYTPMVETYIQNMRPDKDLGRVPVSDEYFLGRINLKHGVEDVNFLPGESEKSSLSKIFGSMRFSRAPKHNAKAAVVGGYMSEGFAQMVIIDMTTFDRQHYDFRFVKREFLGDV